MKGTTNTQNNIPKEIRKRAESAFDLVGRGSWEMQEWGEFQGKKCRFLFYQPADKIQPKRKLKGVITVETYSAYKDFFDTLHQKAMDMQFERSWAGRALAGKLVVVMAKDWETGHTLYRLATRIPGDVWMKVKNYFHRIEEFENPNIDYGFPEPEDWQTREMFEKASHAYWVIVGKENAEKVAEILKAEAEARR